MEGEGGGQGALLRWGVRGAVAVGGEEGDGGEVRGGAFGAGA